MNDLIARARAPRQRPAAGILLRCGIAGFALAWSLAAPIAARAQQAPSGKENDRANRAAQGTALLKTRPPTGFDDLSAAVHTLFDVSFQGRSIGSFDAIFENGQLTFTDPAKVAAAIGPSVDAIKVTELLTKPLAANEQFRCRPGQSPNVGCGLLPGGASGVIVTAEAFQAALFLAREYLTDVQAAPRILGLPSSGPSLIQGVRISGATSGGSGLRYGGTFDTLASVGRTALIAQTTLTDQDGFRIQQAYAQRIWSDRRAAAGILQDFSSLTFANYRLLGAEFGSFYGTYVDNENDTATPIEVVLPRRALVEVYRDAVLIATGQYEAGLQLLDTREFPNGSYTVRVVARDGGTVLLDQRRSFTKVADLPPPGKTGFRVRVGERVRDSFIDSSLTGENVPFFPSTTGELVVGASAERRIGRFLAGGLSVTSIDSKPYSEASLQIFRGRLTGLFAAGVGANGAYSGLVSANVQFPVVSFFLSARSTHASDRSLTESLTSDRYRPFFRTEDTVFGSVQTRALGGSVSVSGSYTRSRFEADRYAVGAQYTRSLRMPLVGRALLTASGTVSDFDKRVGISIAFFRQIDRKTDASFTAGGQYVGNSESGARSGLSPVASAVVTRTEQFGSVDAIGQAGASTDADSDRVFGEVRMLSPLGSADATAQYQTRSTGTNSTSLLFNGQTGFAFGGGGFKFGLRNPADSIVLIDLRNEKASRNSGETASASPDGDGKTPYGPQDDREIAEGGYRITVNARPYDYVKPGQVVAVGLPALKAYSIGLKPEGAPQFDLDVTQRDVAMYPGNVVRLRFQARHIVTMFGQITDAAGTALPGARIEAGSDFAIADDRGYFTITAPNNATVVVKTAAGAPCFQRSIGGLINGRDYGLVYRVGKLSCDTVKGEIQASDPSTAVATKADASTLRPDAHDPAATARTKIAEAKRAIATMPAKF